MDDLSFPYKHDVIIKTRIEFIRRCGPWCGFFFELTKSWGMCLWTNSKIANRSIHDNRAPPPFTFNLVLDSGEEKLVGGWLTREGGTYFGIKKTKRNHLGEIAGFV